MTGFTLPSASNPTTAFFRRSQSHMEALRQEAETLQLQISTGERLERSSDDPVASARLRMLARQERLAETDSANAARASDELTAASTHLEDISDALIRARELTTQAASDSTSPEGRLAIADELDVLRASVLASINATSSTGRALFGGDASGPAYSVDASGNASYAGAATSGTLPIAEGVEVVRGITGPDVLSFDNGGTPTDALAFLRTLADALRGGTADPAQFARDSLAGLDSAIDSSSRNQAALGARIAWIDTLENTQALRAEARASEGGDIGGTDLASAISRLQQVLTTLEASQASFARVSSLTLFDRI